MGRSKAKRRRAVQNAGLRNPVTEWLRDAIVPDRSSSGESVGPKDLLAYPAGWHCLNKISGHVGQLPLNLYERDPSDERKKRLAENLPAYWAVKHQPNPLMSPLTLRQVVQFHALAFGNGRAYIKRNLRGEPAELWPLPPSRCATVLVTVDGSDASVDNVVGGQVVQKWHMLRRDDGTLLPIPDSSVLHIPGLGYDGVQGYSVIDLAKEWLGLAKAQNRAVGGNFKNGARPSFFLKAPPGAFRTAEEAQKFLADVRAQHQGTEADGKIGLLTGGVEAQALQQTAKDSQWQEQRVFSRQDAAIWFQVEQMLGDDSSVSYRSLEEKNRAYVQNCLMTWLTKWEQECWAKLLTTQQRESMRYYFRFTTAALLRGSLAERYQAYMIGRQGEWLSVNDIREAEDMDAREGGDEYINPVVNTRDRANDPPDDSTDEPDGDETDESGPDSPAAIERRRLIAARLKDLIGVEANRVATAAAKRKNFVAWLDEFYADDSFTSRLKVVWREVGGTDGEAAEYAAESKAALLALTDSETAETFPAAVERLVADWPARRSAEWAAQL